MAEALRVEGLVVELGGRRVLDGVGFSAMPGAFLGVVGPNGSGKSTLLRALCRAVPSVDGAVRLLDRPLESFDRRALARTVAILRQEPELAVDFSVEALVALGRSPHQALLDPEGPEDRAAVRRAMEQTGTDALARRRFSTLSGGEKQRVLLARALAQGPQVLLLDEPTNHLDLRHQLEVLALVRGLGLTVIAALHDLALAARFAEQVLVLERGRVAALGAPRAVLDPPLIRRVFGVQARWIGDRQGEEALFCSLPSDERRG